MSRIGRLPIPIPSGVDIAIDGQAVSVKGPKGALSHVVAEPIVVERQDEPMIKALRGFGLTPIPCDFRHFNSFGGSFHCATLDVRRRGTLESYF